MNVSTDEVGRRRPYIKPFVRNLDVVETEGKSHPYSVEFLSTQGFSYATS